MIVAQLMAEKQQIGYMGDMPALVSTTKPQLVDVHLVLVLGTSKQQMDIDQLWLRRGHAWFLGTIRYQYK